ncbi:MAG: U32 family peptidase [Myxococcales bacterium]|nr:U32 family peptidase [Myxococcales bacterium]
MMSHRPEILAPAGDRTSLRAALAAGADAVYFGLADGFNARARAESIDRASLAEVVAECHRAGCRAYVTLNTLVFEPELPVVELLIRDVAAAGVDAIIVQDPAVALIARAVCPALEIHASTQMTVSSAEGARFAQGLGATRVVLPRELSVKEIGRFVAAAPDVETEVFVHGALCVSWSGQCLTSEAWGGRSANRGQCAQACRMPYELFVDGEARPLGEVRYLLSPMDLAGFRAGPALAGLGVATVKIEGRYKGPAYVVSAVEAWRRWLDAVARPGGATAEDEARLAVDLRDLQAIYSRGLSDGFLGGADHQHLVEGRFPKHRGLLLGRVAAVAGSEVVVEPHPAGRPRTGGMGLAAPGEAVGSRDAGLTLIGGSATDNTGAAFAAPEPRAGMGVVFDAGNPADEREPGGPIFAVAALGGGRWRLGFGRPGPDLRRVEPGQRVWLTGDPAIERRARRLVESAVEGRVPLRLRVGGREGAPLWVEARAAGARVRVEGAVLSAARGAGIDEALLAAKLGAVGGTAFRLIELDAAALAPGLHLPVSALKSLRRSMVEALEAAIERLQARTLAVGPVLPGLRHAPRPARAALDDRPRLVALCRTDAHLDAVIAAGGEGIAAVELDWMERAGLERAVARARAAGLPVHVATPRVQKPGEEGFDRRIARLGPDGVLVRHWGALMHFKEHPEERRPELHGDFSLNVTNGITAAHLLDLGLDTVTAAHDLDAEQLFALVEAMPAERLAVTVHHHIPTFHTEHCVYAHLLSHGRDIKSCGQPCQRHEIGLRDAKGHTHPVVVDPACRNTVYNAQAQSAAGLVPRLIAAGVRRLRVEFVRESAEEALRVLWGYRALVGGEIGAAALIERLRVHEQFGVTRGTMQVAR